MERHQAEIRRAVADEQLSWVANSITGEETRIEWMAEGRRLIPLIPRAIPQTKASNKATAAASDYLKKQKECKVEVALPPSSSSFSSSSASSLNRSNLKVQNKETIVVVEKKKKDNEVSDSIKTSFNHSAKRQKVAEQPDVYCLSGPTPPFRPSSNDQNREPAKLIVNASITNPSNSVTKIAFAPTIVASVAKSFSSVVPSVMSTDTGAVTAFLTSTPSHLSTRQTIVSSDRVITPVSTTNALISVKENTKCQTTLPKAATQVKLTPTQITIPCTSAAKLLSPGKTGTTLTPQVVVFSSQSQPKTITIPISQSGKTLQLPASVASGTPTIFYQSTSSSSNMVGPSGFTIKTFKSGQTPLPGNYIIMPKNATVVRPTSFRTITIPKESAPAQEISPTSKREPSKE